MFAPNLVCSARLSGALSLLLALATHATPIFVARASAQSPSADPPEVTSKEEGQAADKSDPEKIPDPELIALSWQYRPQASGKRLKQPVWRPDGTRLNDVETNALLDEVKSFQNHWWNEGQLQPLVMVFRRSAEIKSGLSVAVVCDGRKHWGGTWGPFGEKGLAKSACAPQVGELARWPESVDLDVRVPLEDPQIIKTINAIPEGAVDVSPGVRWYIDPDLGIDHKRGGQRREHLTAAVLEIDNIYESPESLLRYDSTVWLSRPATAAARLLRREEGAAAGRLANHPRKRPTGFR
ncbi:MAG: hypothetical protein ACREHD_30990 [Pirellulales bacterium]